MRSAVTAAMFAVLVSGCASAPPPPPNLEHASAVYDADFDDVWVAVIEQLSMYQSPVTEMEKESGFFTTDWGLASEDWLACGSAGGFHWYSSHQGKYNVFVKEQPEGGVQVRVNTSWQAAETGTAGMHAWHPCTTTGVFERQFHQELATRLGSE